MAVVALGASQAILCTLPLRNVDEDVASALFLAVFSLSLGLLKHCIHHGWRDPNFAWALLNCIVSKFMAMVQSSF